VNFSCALLPTRSGGGAWNFDFGKNMAGFCTISLPPDIASLSTNLTLVHGEILNGDGNVENTFGSSDGTRRCPAPGINCADQTDVWLRGAGGGASSYTPSFTFHGFRHVALLGWPPAAPAPSAAVLTCHVVHTRMGPAGGASFNSTVLNELQAAVVRTERSNLFSVPSDCPTREKRGWGGDAAVTTKQAMLNLAAAPLYAAWTRTFVDLAAMSCSPPGAGLEESAAVGGGAPRGGASLPPARPPDYVCCPPGRFGCQPGLTPTNASGFLPDVLPFDSISGWPGDFIWQSVGLVVPHTLFSLVGALSPAERAWPMSAALLAAADREAKGGLLLWGPYADWLSTEAVSRLFAENFYWVLSLQQGAELAGALGRPLDAAALTALADAVSAAMVGALFHPAQGVWDAPLPGVGGSMNAQGMALAVGLGGAATANATVTITAALVADAAAHGNRPTGGVASSRWVLEGFDAAGRGDLALTMATTVSSPSWGYMVMGDDMPGTIWEEWGGDATHSDGSKNHPMVRANKRATAQPTPNPPSSFPPPPPPSPPPSHTLVHLAHHYPLERPRHSLAYGGAGHVALHRCGASLSRGRIRRRHGRVGRRRRDLIAPRL
jgi:alpha-L-rhamnosidase